MVERRYSDRTRYRALRHYSDARPNLFDEHCDEAVDDWIDWLKKSNPEAYFQLLEAEDE